MNKHYDYNGVAFTVASLEMPTPSPIANLTIHEPNIRGYIGVVRAKEYGYQYGLIDLGTGDIAKRNGGGGIVGIAYDGALLATMVDQVCAWLLLKKQSMQLGGTQYRKTDQPKQSLLWASKVEQAMADFVTALPDA